MSVLVQLSDGEGASRTAGVTSRRALKVSIIPNVAAEQTNEVLTARKLYRAFLVEPGGSKEMNVDGSVTAVNFDVSAENNLVIWITAVRIILNGVNLEMDTNDFRRFGAATVANTPLPNGVQLFVIQPGIETAIFVDPVVVAGDFFNYSDADKNISNAITAQSDFLSFDFIFDAPVALPASSKDSICLRIRDDLTAIDLFRCIARGYQETT